MNKVIILRSKRGKNKPKPELRTPGFFAELIKKLSGGGITGNKILYKKVGINQKRWSMLISGQISPTIDEIGRVLLFFEKKGCITTTFTMQLFNDTETSSIEI